MEWYSIVIICVLVSLLIFVAALLFVALDELEKKQKCDDLISTLNTQLIESRREIGKLYAEKRSNYLFVEFPYKHRINYLENENEILKKHNSKLQEELDQLKVPVNRCCEDATRMPDYGLYKCECGEEEFTHLRGSEHNGIKGEIPYNENEYQCVRCGRLHTIKQKMYGTNIQLDRVIKKEV